MTNWGELIVFAEEYARAAAKTQLLQPVSKPTEPVVLQPVAPTPSAETKTLQEWLISGPDDYDTINDEIVSSTQENTHRYGPLLLWAVFINNTGSSDLLVRFTNSPGRVNQYTVKAGKDLSVDAIGGGLGSEFRVVAKAAGTSTTMNAMISLKKPR